MEEPRDSGRRNFLKTATGATLAVLLDPVSSLSGAEVQIKKKNLSKTPVEHNLEENVRQICKKIANGIGIFDGARNPRDYRRAYDGFMVAHEDSIRKSSPNPHSVYEGLRVISLMHAARVLSWAGNNIVKPRKLGDAYRVDNLETALGHYNRAFELRKQLNENKNAMTIVYTSELGEMKVADQEFIIEKIKQTYKALIDFTEGGKRNTYQTSLANFTETYSKSVPYKK